LANSTLIILFSEMLKFSKIISSKSKNIVKDNSEYLGIFHLLKGFFSKLINYSTDMCWNGQGTTIVEYGYFRNFFPSKYGNFGAFLSQKFLCVWVSCTGFFWGSVMEHGPYLPINPSGFRVCSVIYFFIFWCCVIWLPSEEGFSFKWK